MLVILVKTALIVLLVFFVIRLMGKRQIGEMQPFEFVITLILAEVACLPMNDPSIPLHTGVVPVITLAFLDIMLTFVSRLSYRFRKLADGGSVIVIGPSGFISDNMRKMNMNVDDILVSARTGGYPDVSELEYAIVEPNGKFSFVPKRDASASTLPVPLIVDGKIIEANAAITGVTEESMTKVILSGGLKRPKDVLYMDVRRDGKVYVSPMKGKCYTRKVRVAGAA